MSIFGRQTPGPTRINAVQINQSVLGYALPVVMGRGKVQQSILWSDGFSSKLITTGGGKGFGGGKGGNQYVYSADVIAALCNGGDNGIVGIGDVWSGQSWLSNTDTSETWTITSGLVYTPTNSVSYTADAGVGVSTAYSGTYNDLGANTPTVLSGVHVVSMLRMPFGTTLAEGQYSVNPANNQYLFAAANIGQTVTMFYSFALATVTRQQIDLIPSGLTVEVGGTIPFAADGGVTYYTGTNAGQPLAQVGGTPTATGTYAVTGSAPATYTFAPGDVEAEVAITYKLDNSSALPQGTSTSLGFTLFAGTPRQSPWALLSTNFPGAALGYSGIAFVAYGPMDLGYGAQIQQNVFEVLTADGWGGGIADCNPIQCILQILTNKVWGLGAGAVPFPAGAIDNSSAGTWGAPIGTGAPIMDSTASSWFAANGFFISPVIDRQDTAASLISKYLEAGQCAAFMSEGLLKLVPYGDTSVAGNGVVWVAPSAFAAAFDDDAFIAKGKNADPVKPSSEPWQDAYNTVTVTWNNRANQYAPEPTQESDQAAINRYGSRIEDPQAWDFITTLPAAVFAASVRVKRNVYQRNTYEFSTSYRYTNLEPMDVVPLTTSSMWAAGANNPLGMIALPVRLIKKVDNPNGTIDWTAEDYLGVNNASRYNKALAAGALQPNLFADPGDTDAIIFEAPARLTGYLGDQIWIGATGANEDWGGCNVLVSMDGDKYLSIGTVETPARLGVLHSDLPAGADPDTTNTMVVDLVENSSPLEAGTTADADQDNTLCWVDGELIAYSACASSGVDQYTAGTYLRRGQMGTTASAHAAGGVFLRLDAAVFKFTYDPTWYGKTVFLKFQSFNVYGNSAQDLSGLTAVSFTVPGLNPGTVSASTGLVSSAYLPPNVAQNIGCNAAASSAYDTGTLTSSVSVFGPGGAGTSWDYVKGGITTTYPAGTVTGATPNTGVYVIYDTHTNTFSLIPATSYQNTLADFYIVLAALTTASATTTTTGGGTGGGSGSGYGRSGSGYAPDLE